MATITDQTPPGATTQDWGRVDDWMTSNLPGYRGPSSISRFEGGQSNPTFRLDSASGSYVLRRKPTGAILPSAHAVDREFRILSALRESGVPVANVLGYCDDDEVIGSAFYVMEFVAGRTFWDPRLPQLSRTERSAIFDSMNEIIARLHTIDPASVGLEGYGRPENFLERQVGRWIKQYRASETEEIAAMDSLIDWLPSRVPKQMKAGIVHGDYRLDNVLIHPTEPRVVAVLDWELSTLGDTLADFAYHVMSWRVPADVFRGLGGVDTAKLGIPDEATYIACYCERTGQDEIPSWEFYIVYALFRLAAITQGVARRARDGNAASEKAFEVGRATRPVAEQAWALARTIKS